VAHPSGTIFFTDPNFNPGGREDWQFIYRIAPDGSLVLAVEGSFNRPNGIALSPDEKTLYVNIGWDHMTLAWPLDENGAVSGPSRRLADGFDRGPDGMAVHPKTGDIFIALFWNNRREPDEQGINIFSPAGKYKGMIPIPGTTTNCTLGPDGDTLRVTSGGALYRVDLGENYAGERITATKRVEP
jgi:sugar lactone lactonase YvrE